MAKISCKKIIDKTYILLFLLNLAFRAVILLRIGFLLSSE